jgi:wyosine [tRNA(Phe)-imidazoG37] synthetase (radical SAM superfamily)
MAEKKYKYVFGPVPSRRLGRSLGIDLVPYKTCSLDCVYCQLGRTTDLTARRAEYVPTAEVAAEIEAKFKGGQTTDVVTLSGSGEPTLHTGFGDVIAAARRATDAPVVVLTNATLMTDPEVRRDLARADVVVPSLDAGDAAMFERVNRPAPGLDFQEMVESLTGFSRDFTGQLNLEVFILAGLTDRDQAAAKIAALAEKIHADRIQLNTVVRPTAEADAQSAGPDTMNHLCALFGPRAEVIADFNKTHQQADVRVRREDVLAMIDRRPVTAADVSGSLGIHQHEAIKHLEHLVEEGRARRERIDDRVFYTGH